ncbi:hypothetical protein Pst134EA_029457 [Puccinia striiformis f. sp. tritici]|uniref:DNA 3'-5' helicase n=1 Tax=Puccinia striiformis f. sp. tritici PST-78 TaxID=1165861 RepID=A0A0L0V726_9BASI|nr:hypothetical protein Pst134EA_029457 [Puccinia striiformis f. sp. tritici]KAH9447418.1 hypothetical protein Pst134EA_029457 [Puccinia striiformis f. sp. tritici]KNE94809.1 hypothetical protein PSTG_11821 [Puccinia striiformis f. sp. tritici PST-78]
MALLKEEPVKAKPNKLPEALQNLDSDALAGHITTGSVNLYHDQPKALQVEAVLSLVQGKHTFVRAETGYGKTRISEMFFGLFERRVVVLVLVPLDSLGDDQVREKKLVNITAINLNKMTLNWVTVRKIQKGNFSFVYLSPEVFLNSSLFTELFFSDAFQDILALIVVDEAHMVYLWGLVVSKQSKTLIIFVRLEDQGIFRVAYGHIGTCLMATNNIPVLLLTATCRPEAVSSITTSLMLQPSDLNMIDGELTRPEIRFIRIYMDSTLSSCDDLLRLFAPHSFTPADQAVPMIIYSGTRNRTFQVMKVVNEARKTKTHEYDPHDRFIRRYHSVTGDQEKARALEDFGNADVPVISATMALGLGQNLKRVRCVEHMGRGDPSAIVQMVGRCGRDGRPGLGLLFMERTRKNGKNKVSDFEEGKGQNNDDRMDALAVTPCCLRKVMTLDNKVGYIPLSDDDTNIHTERAREDSLGFSKCDCSTCMPAEAEALIKGFQQLTASNFDRGLKNPFSMSKDPTVVILTRKRDKQAHKGTCRYPLAVARELVQHLIYQFDEFYYNLLSTRAEFPPGVFFGLTQAETIVASIDQVRAGDDHDTSLMEGLIGGEEFDGQMECLDLAISSWLESDYYKLYLRDQERMDNFIDVEGRRLREEMAAELAKHQERAEGRRLAEQAAKVAAKAVEKARKTQEKAEERLRLCQP